MLKSNYSHKTTLERVACWKVAASKDLQLTTTTTTDTMSVKSKMKQLLKRFQKQLYPRKASINAQDAEPRAEKTQRKLSWKRLFHCTDCSSPSKSLCVDAELLGHMRTALLKNRQLEEGTIQLEVNLSAVEEAVAKANDKIQDLELQLAEALEQPVSEVKVGASQVRTHLRTISQLRNALEKHADRIRKGIEAAENRQALHQSHVVAALDDIFVDSEMLDEYTVPELPVTRDLLQTLEDAGEAIDAPIPDSEQDSSSDEQVDDENTAQKEAKRALLHEYLTGKRTLDQARMDLETRDQVFEQEKEANEQAREAGDKHMSALSLDLLQLRKTQGMTRTIIEAEESLARIENEALNAGLRISGSDLVSEFEDDVDDGYRMSFEQDMTASVDRERVTAWLTGVPECDAATVSKVLEEVKDLENVETDDWDASSVEMWESHSMVADGSERAKIDQWRDMSAFSDADA